MAGTPAAPPPWPVVASWCRERACVCGGKGVRWGGRLPEVLAERFDAFRADRDRLQRSYGALGASAATEDVTGSMPPDRLGELLIQLVEVVIQIRRTRDPEAAGTDAIASSCLRLCGLGEPGVAAARDEAGVLLSRLA